VHKKNRFLIAGAAIGCGCLLLLAGIVQVLKGAFNNQTAIVEVDPPLVATPQSKLLLRESNRLVLKREQFPGIALPFVTLYTVDPTMPLSEYDFASSTWQVSFVPEKFAATDELPRLSDRLRKDGIYRRYNLVWIGSFLLVGLGAAIVLVPQLVVRAPKGV